METMETLATGYTLIEGPLWDPARGLLFSDVHEGGVYCLAPSGARTTVIEHRRGIGGMVLHERGGLVIGGRNIAYKGPAAEGTLVLLDSERAGGGVGFNDLTTDEEGRIYVGSLGASPFDPARTLAGEGGGAGEVLAQAEQKTGFLHVIDLDGTSRVLAPGIQLTNGLGFSPDGHRLYHSDSRAHMVGVYDLHSDHSVSERRVFARVEPGVPDGLAVAEDGSVWVAVAGGGVVRVFDADGSERRPIEVPLPMVTSLCFGGDDQRDLFVVTGSTGGPSDHSGTVYRTRVDVPGLAVPLARVALQRAV
jgi:xylono-1,5-lactonase